MFQTFSEQEIRALRAANPARGWSEIPDECPAQFVSKIVEIRARRIGLGRVTAPESAAPQVDVDALREQLSAASL